MLTGIYAVFGPQNRVYVGESNDILSRTNVRFARRMGLDFTILKLMPLSGKRERYTAEKLFGESYKRAGLNVVSLNRDEVTARALACIDFPMRADALRQSWRDNPERHIAQSERMKQINARRTAESRSCSVRKGWATRRELARRIGQ